MAYPDFTAGSVMDAAAALLNDAGKSAYTYAVQIPYLNIALKELQEYFELNNIPVTDTVSSVITVPAGSSSIGFAPASPIMGTPYLPADLVEPKIVWERQYNTNPYVPMSRVDSLPRYDEGIEINQFLVYTWQSQQIRVLAANQINQLKLDYIKYLFADVTVSTDVLSTVNGESFLQYRTAGLVAQFVAEDVPRATTLNNDAGLAIDRVAGIGTKGRQRIITRRRPFRSAFKSRTYT